MRAICFAEEEISIDPDTAVVAFYNRCKPGNVASATAHLRQIPVATLTLDASNSVARRSIPSTYVVCTDDQVPSPAMQRAMATHACASLKIDSDHFPFLSCLAEPASLLSTISSFV